VVHLVSCLALLIDGPFIFALLAQKAATNLLSNADMMIAEFESSFAGLKIEFIMGSTLQTALTTVRILETVENIGMYCLCPKVDPPLYQPTFGIPQRT